MRTLIAAIAVLVPATAFAAPCDHREGLLRQAFPAAVSTSTGMTIAGEYMQRIRPEDVACKTWPFVPEFTLLAVPLLEVEPASEGEVRGDVEVIVVDSKTGAPIARRREKGMAYADAIQFTGVELDTARYDIKPEIRAFGLITRQFGSSMVNPYSERALWLYSLEDGHIHRVLDGLVVMQLNAEHDGNCAGTETEVNRTISIASTEHEGYRDLVVDEILTDSVAKPENDDCKSAELSRKTKQVMLWHEGGNYRPSINPGDDRLFSYIEIAEEP